MNNGIKFKLAVDGAARVKSDFDDIAGSMQRVKAGSEKLRANLGTLASAFGFGYLATQFVQQADAMTLLDARLKNAVGTGQQYAAAQRAIFEIAQANNIGLQETTQLYIKLADPVLRLGGTTREVTGITNAFAMSLRVGGASAQEAASATLQFAQAMGSGKLQGDEFRAMAEASPRFLKALADGMGQPIEKLKEMGSEGKLTADVVGNALLKSLGQLQDEAATLPDTVGGALTRLQNEALLTVTAFDSMTGSSRVVAETVGIAAQWVAEMAGAVKDLDAGTRGMSGSVDLAAAGFSVIGTVLETVVLIASDVTFVLKGIGREIGGIAAQGSALLSGDFAAVGAIRREMLADAERARAELDKFQGSVGGATSRILQSRDALKNHSLSAAENANELARITARAGGSASAFKVLTSSIVDTAEADKLAAEAAKQAAKASADRAKQAAKTAADLESALGEYERARRDELKTGAQTLASLEQETQSLRDRYIELTAGKEVLQALVLVRMEDAAAARDQMAATMALAGENELAIQQQRLMAVELRKQIEWRKKISTTTDNVEADKANAKAAQDAADEWQRTSDQIGQSLADALMTGGKNAGEYIKGLFRTMVLQPVLRAAVQPIAGALTGALGFAQPAAAAGQAAGGFGNLVGMAGMAGSIGTFGTTLGMGASATMAGSSLAAFSGASSMIGAGNVAGGIGMGLGASVPYIAAAMAIYAIAKSLDDSGTPHMGSVVSGSGLDLRTLMGDRSTITDNLNPQTDQALRALIQSSTGILSALGGGQYSATARFASDNNDPSIGQFTFAKDGRQVGFLGAENSGSATGDGSDYTRYNSDAGTGLQEFTADVVRLTRAQLDTLDLPGWAQTQLDKLGQDADLSQLAGVAAAIEATTAEIGNLRDALAPLSGVFTQFAGLTSDAVYELATAFGGSAALAQTAAGYYQAFYSEAERAADSTQLVTDALSGVGLQMPATRDAFRDLVEAQDLSTQSGRDAFTTLLSVSGAFAELNPALEITATSAKAAADVMRERQGLETELLRLQGDTAELRRRELAALAPANVALQESIYALQDWQSAQQSLQAAIAAEAAAAAQAQAEADARAAEIFGERAGLERQLLQLQGDSLAIQALERDALHETNRSIYDQITALQAAAVAQNQAAAAAIAAAQAQNAAAAAAAQAASQIAGERASLERRLLELQGDTLALRALERDALHESNRGLYDQITALQAATVAQQQAGDAAKAAAAGAAQMAQTLEDLTRGALDGVATAYATVVQAVQDEQQRVQSDTEAAISAVQAHAEAAFGSLEQQARQIEQTFGGLAQAIAEHVRGLESELLADGGRAAALDALRAGAQDLRSGRSVDSDALRAAAAAASRLDEQDFGSAVDFRRAISQTSVLLREVSGSATRRQADELSSVASQQVAIEMASAAEIAALEALRDGQLAALDKQLSEARGAASSLVEIVDGVQSVASAIGALAAAISAASTLQGNRSSAAETGRWLSSGGTDVWNAAGGAFAARQAGASNDGTLIKGLASSFSAADAQGFVNDKLASGDLVGIYARAVLEGIDSSALDSLMGWAPGSSAAEAMRLGLPAFAAGGMHSGGARLVGEFGPELEVTGPARIWNADDTAAMLGNGTRRDDALVSEIKALRAEVAALRADAAAQQGAIATHTNKAARLLDKWDTEGLPQETTV